MTTSGPVYGPSAKRESEASVSSYVGDPMSETKTQMIAQYPVRSRELLPPDESAPVPFRVSRAGRVVDVILPQNVVVVTARLGRVSYRREDAKTSLAEFLAREPQEVKAGTYCVFTVLNVGAKPVEVVGKVLVEGEHGEAVEGLPLREATADDAPSIAVSRDAARRERDAANDAMMDALIDNAMMADGSLPTAKVQPAKSSKAAPLPPTRSGGLTSGSEPVPRTIKPQKIMTRSALRQHHAERAAAKAAKTASGETRVVFLHVAYATMLDVSLGACIPLNEGVRGVISAAMREADEAEVVQPADSEVVAIRLSEDAYQRLAEAIDARVEYTLDDTDAMCAAIRQALEGGAAAPDEQIESKTIGSSALPEAATPLEEAPAAETETSPARVEETEVGNVTPIHGKVQDDGRPQSRPGALAKSVVNEA